MPQSSTSPREGALFLYPLLTGSGSDTGLDLLSCQGSLGTSAINESKQLPAFHAGKVSGVTLNICTRWHKAPLLWSDWQAPTVIKGLAWPERRQTIFFLDLLYSSAGMLTHLMVPANWKVFKIKKKSQIEPICICYNWFLVLCPSQQLSRGAYCLIVTW